MKREKAIKEIIERKKTLERNVDKQNDAPLQATPPEQIPPPSTSSEPNSLPALVEITDTQAPEADNYPEITVVNPIPREDNAQAESVPGSDEVQLLPLNDAVNGESKPIRESESASVVQVNDAISVVVTDDSMSGEKKQ